tara:strand:+ start:3194 stop:4177 length:984 start_codon:yes stop_codon:yes gene_type:complete
MKTKINKYISSLLSEHNCVIIPNFGGFVANYESARIDNNSQFIYAPKKSIVFNKSLQSNDGLLINEIATIEGKTFKQAKIELDKYVLDLKESLRLHKKVFLNDVGTLILGSEENILFVQSNSHNHLLDSFGLYTIQYPTIHRTTVQDKFEEKIKAIDRKRLASNKKALLKIAAVLLPIFMISAFGISNKDKIKSNYANLMPFTFSNVEAVETKPLNSLDPFIIESPTNSIEKAVKSFYEIKQKKFLDKTNDLHKHFIIAGSFSSEENAQKMISKLTKEKYKNSKIVNKSSSGYLRVSYESYSKSNEALIALRKIKKTNPSAWLLSLK